MSETEILKRQLRDLVQKQQNRNLQSDVVQHLRNAGIPEDNLHAAMSLLLQDDRARIAHDDEHVFVNSYGLEQPLSSGVSEWVRSGEAAMFRSDTAQRRVQTPRKTIKDPNLAQAYESALASLEQKLGR